jgi:hypothetical protein
MQARTDFLVGILSPATSYSPLSVAWVEMIAVGLFWQRTI